MNNNSNPGGLSADWLMSAVKKNPEGLLLLAAGCALLFRTRTSRSRQWSHGYQSYPSGQGQHGPRMEHRGSGGKDWEMPEGMSRAADTAREYASNVGKTVGETARSYASAAGEYADHASQTIRDQSGRIAEQTQSMIERIVREQPLAVAIAGAAAGAALAAAFPSTRMERETLGPTGKRLSEAATSAGEKLSKAASAAGERLMSAADERGVNAEGLKEVARDVAGSFEKSFSGSGPNDGRSGDKQDTAPSGSGATPYSAGSARAVPAGTPGQTSNSTFGAGSRFDPKPPSGR
ncbi:MAG: hypothetical protein WAN75_31720 [Xanthobacteraceae bacterium]|jgi:hypothetical protein